MFRSKKIRIGLVIVTLVGLASLGAPRMIVFADTPAAPTAACGSEGTGTKGCSKVPPSDCPAGAGQCPAATIQNNKIVKDVINPAIKVFTVLVGVVSVIMLIVAGIIYSSAADDPNRIKLAKKIIIDVVIGIAAYVFLYSFLNYILPQGIG